MAIQIAPALNSDLTAAPHVDLCLLGQPSLGSYLDFVKAMAVGGETADRKVLCDEWRRANDHYHDLEKLEAGLASDVETFDLDPVLDPLVQVVTGDPVFRKLYDVLPTSFAMVQLDRLTICQTRVSYDFVTGLQAKLGPDPGPEALFQFCMPSSQRTSPLRISRAGPGRYAFTSESADLRYHGSVILEPGQVSDYVTHGPIGGVLGLVVGFGSNLLNVLRSDGRLLLHDGYHRACALRAAGITHAPCVIQDITRLDELALVAPSKVVDSAAFYFRAARPPLLKDFFDPRLRKLIPVRRSRRVIEISYETREYDVPD